MIQEIQVRRGLKNGPIRRGGGGRGEFFWNNPMPRVPPHSHYRVVLLKILDSGVQQRFLSPDTIIKEAKTETIFKARTQKLQPTQGTQAMAYVHIYILCAYILYKK